MTFLVFGATGAQGGAVARRLVAQGHRVRGFGRTANVPEGVEAFTGPLEEAFDGVTHASVVVPMDFERAEVDAWAETIAKAAGGVRRLVFNTGNRIPDQATDVPMFESRRAAADTVLASGVPTVVLRPPVYLDNLRLPWTAARLEHDGVLSYPLPALMPVAWLSHADLATATLAALTRDGLEGETFDLAGPDTVTGPELAAAFGSHVTYEAQDLDAFESGLAHAFGPRVAADVAATYRWLAVHGGDLYGPAPSTAQRLGVTLTGLRDWIAG